MEVTTKYLYTRGATHKTHIRRVFITNSHIQICKPFTLPRISLHVWHPMLGLLYHNNTRKEPDATLREMLMGFQAGTEDDMGLTETQRIYILGQSMDVNILTWLIAQATQPTPTQHISSFTMPTQTPTIDSALPYLPTPAGCGGHWPRVSHSP